MTRTDSSTLIALAELHTMERERSERELEERRAQQEDLRQQQQERERLALEAEQRQAAEQEARRVEAERRRAWQAAEDRRRVEEIEARARAEQDARLADVQRELSAALDRRKMRRTGRLAAMGLGTALLASAASVAVWMGTSQPAAPPRVAVELPVVDVDALSHGLARLREDNASLRDELLELQARAEAAAETTEGRDTAVEPTSTEGPRARPRRPRPRPDTRQSKPPTSKEVPPPSGRRTGRLEYDDGSKDLLAGLENKRK